MVQGPLLKNNISDGSGTVHADDPSTATLLGMRTRAYK